MQRLLSEPSRVREDDGRTWLRRLLPESGSAGRLVSARAAASGRERNATRNGLRRARAPNGTSAGLRRHARVAHHRVPRNGLRHGIRPPLVPLGSRPAAKEARARASKSERLCVRSALRWPAAYSIRCASERPNWPASRVVVAENPLSSEQVGDKNTDVLVQVKLDEQAAHSGRARGSTRSSEMRLRSMKTWI